MPYVLSAPVGYCALLTLTCLALPEQLRRLKSQHRVCIGFRDLGLFEPLGFVLPEQIPPTVFCENELQEFTVPGLPRSWPTSRLLFVYEPLKERLGFDPTVLPARPISSRTRIGEGTLYSLPNDEVAARIVDAHRNGCGHGLRLTLALSDFWSRAWAGINGPRWQLFERTAPLSEAPHFAESLPVEVRSRPVGSHICPLVAPRKPKKPWVSWEQMDETTMLATVQKYGSGTMTFLRWEDASRLLRLFRRNLGMPLQVKRQIVKSAIASRFPWVQTRAQEPHLFLVQTKEVDMPSGP